MTDDVRGDWVSVRLVGPLVERLKHLESVLNDLDFVHGALVELGGRLDEQPGDTRPLAEFDVVDTSGSVVPPNLGATASVLYRSDLDRRNEEPRGLGQVPLEYKAPSCSSSRGLQSHARWRREGHRWESARLGSRLVPCIVLIRAGRCPPVLHVCSIVASLDTLGWRCARRGPIPAGGSWAFGGASTCPGGPRTRPPPRAACACRGTSEAPSSGHR